MECFNLEKTVMKQEPSVPSPGCSFTVVFPSLSAALDLRYIGAKARRQYNP